MKLFQKLIIYKFILIFSFHLTANPVFARSENFITVSATVPPKPADFQFEFSILKEEKGQKTSIPVTYQITYGAKQTANMTTDITIVASWDKNSEYIESSATNALGNFKPELDLEKRRITWNIKEFPQGALDQTVSFQLQNFGYSKESKYKIISTSARMKNQYLSLPDQKIIYLLNLNTLATKAQTTLSQKLLDIPMNF